MATTAAAMICPQGHGPGGPGAVFCVRCGSQLVGALAQGQTQAAGTTPVGMMAPPAAAPALGAAGGQPAAPPIQMWTPPTPAFPPQNSTSAVGPPAAWTPMPKAKAVGKKVAVPPPPCRACGDGARLDPAQDVCAECGWLRPLFPGYQLDRSVFLWAQDGQAMAKLQSISALHTVVRSVSDKVGRPWIESTFNAIRLGPRQLPDVWKQAILAARIMGLPKMPDVYISGDQMWNTYTYGTETSSFIVLGTSHLINFANDEMLFVLAREMGHCRAGHALWKTVTRFLAGDVSVHSGILSNGVLNAINPTRLIEGAIDLPLMAWSRQSDITADRAGLMAVGDEALARRVLLAWSIRSARLLQMVNIEEWMKQEEASDDQMTKFSEMTTSSSMYTTRRLRLLSQSAREPELMRWSQSIQPIRKQLAPAPVQIAGLGVGTVRAAKAAAPAAAAHPVADRPDAGAAPVKPATIAGQPVTPAAATLTPADSMRVVCPKCQTPMRIPLAVLRGKPSLNVRCPKCHNVLTLRPKAAAAAPTTPAPEPVGAQANPVVQQPLPAGAQTRPDAPLLASAGKKK